jgi:hypothetical protein
MRISGTSARSWSNTATSRAAISQGVPRTKRYHTVTLSVLNSVRGSKMESAVGSLDETTSTAPLDVPTCSHESDMGYVTRYKGDTYRIERGTLLKNGTPSGCDEVTSSPTPVVGVGISVGEWLEGTIERVVDIGVVVYETDIEPDFRMDGMPVVTEEFVGVAYSPLGVSRLCVYPLWHIPSRVASRAIRDANPSLLQLNGTGLMLMRASPLRVTFYTQQETFPAIKGDTIDALESGGTRLSLPTFLQLVAFFKKPRVDVKIEWRVGGKQSLHLKKHARFQQGAIKLPHALYWKGVEEAHLY